MKLTPHKIPEIIYLQWYGCDQKDMIEHPGSDPWEKTYCEDRIYDTDVVYRRVRKGSGQDRLLRRAAEAIAAILDAERMNLTDSEREWCIAQAEGWLTDYDRSGIDTTERTGIIPDEASDET